MALDFRLRFISQRIQPLHHFKVVQMMAGLVKAKQLVFDSLFGDESRFDVRDEFVVEFKQGNYAYNTVYSGLIPLKRHFFPVIGDLKSEGEEFECAEFIANQLEGVEWWVRNTDRKPTSFWLQTALDRFYPDFIVQLKSGLILVVEYKGKHLSEWSDSREKSVSESYGQSAVRAGATLFGWRIATGHR